MKRLLNLLFVISVSVQAQHIPTVGVNKVRITEPDRTIVTEINPATEPSVQSDRIYYWYSANKIHTTQGGFSGNLLNGRYQEFYPDKSLKEQGEFKKGVKHGEWKTWNLNGSLAQLISWKNGAMQGSFSKYDEQGILLQAGKYKDNLIDGKLYTYNGSDPVQVTTYKNGKPVVAKVSAKSSFFKKLWPFGKKQGVKKEKAAKPAKAPKAT